jgi:hypothetical protein
VEVPSWPQLVRWCATGSGCGARIGEACEGSSGILSTDIEIRFRKCDEKNDSLFGQITKEITKYSRMTSLRASASLKPASAD